MNASSASSSHSDSRRVALRSAAQFGLADLRNASGLALQMLPHGVPFAWRHGSTLINQLLTGPAENGLFRLLLRWRDASGHVLGWKSLVAAGEPFSVSTAGAVWACAPLPRIHCETTLALHPDAPAWSWRIRLHNESDQAVQFDALHAQDLGLADEGAVRNNEAYTSQYIDLLPLRDDTLGWTMLARQNQPQAHGRHPWAGFACATGAEAFCTDGWQFFGQDHRLTNEPAAIRLPSLPSQRLQYEFALAGLQSRVLALAPGTSGEIVFFARFLEDHPAASSAGDLALLHDLRPFAQGNPESVIHYMTLSPSVAPVARSLFSSASWLHGETPTDADWSAWFPGQRRHEEVSTDGQLLSFFHGEATHVVARTKEAQVARPHGHILRSGDSLWFDSHHFGFTCYAAGIFSAQAYLGHPNFARLLSVVRNALNVTRGSGQRVFIRRGEDWHQLGIPSAFAMTPAEARWIYRLGADVIVARAWCARGEPAAFLELEVNSGGPVEFLVSHELVLGASEFEHPAVLEISPSTGTIFASPAPGSLVGQHQPGVAFALGIADPTTLGEIGGDGLLYPDAVERGGPYAVLRTKPVKRCAVIMVGTESGPDALPSAFAQARAAMALRPAAAPAAPVHLHGIANAAMSRLDDVLPWFAHNASIHFSAPHGLEQYGGAAWGVRDVCQGSVEWLLAAGEFGVVRRILEAVFAQQYPTDGGWPQWFMFPPYRFIQQAHSHGDVCFWPVKALCDYVEATNDLAFLQARVGYTDPQRFETTGPEESILAHCERVLAQAESRFVAGTALVNYGDGDWDDTLQPADPAMRTRMISAWTVALAYHTCRQLAEVSRRAGDSQLADRLTDLLARMRRDFAAQLMPGGVVAGFLITETDGRTRPLLHPQDAVTHIRYRLLPMTRSILAELFTPEEARRHLEIIAQELRYPDGVRLMSEPSTYAGGIERIFKRAETAANVGREIGLQYVHAHLRYAEALAKVGDADGLFAALQIVNPVGLGAVVPNAAPRQSNVYFSSSDADFADRYEAEKRWSELRTGSVAVRGGWRLYSSGPGLFLHKVRACLLGVRERFDGIVLDPVLPRSLDGLSARTTLWGRRIELRYRVREGNFAPRSLRVNGRSLPADGRETNPYRSGGSRLSRSELEPLLTAPSNVLEIDL